MGNVIGSHSHDYCELVYYRAGEGDSTINNYSYLYSENCFSFIPYSVPHDEKAYSETTLSCVVFETEICSNISGVFSDTNKDFLHIIDEICKETDSPSKNSAEIIENYINIIEYKLLRLSGNDPYIKREKDPLLDTAYNYILNYYNTNIYIWELAAMVGYSTDRFRHIFKDRYGISPKNEKENLSLEQIGKQCGFPTPSQFCVTFKKIQGITPSEYKAIKKKASPVGRLIKN
jgi:AraC family transcriptional activator of pobA